MRVVIAISLCAAVLAFVMQAARAQTPVYTVAKVAVNTEAQDAVTAKQKATREGAARAFRMLMSRMVAFDAHNRLPELSGDAIEGMLDGVVVREERFSSTRYIASLDFTFDAEKVRDLLNRVGLPHTDQQSPQVKLLPLAGGEAAGTVWRDAWDALDLEHSLTPVDLAPARAGNLPEGTTLTPQAMSALRDRLGGPRVVLASAALDDNRERMRVALRGADAIGPFAFSQSFRVYDGDVAAAARQAAEIAHMALEARWRLTSLKSQGALDGPAPLEQFQLTAAFDSLKTWQEMRDAINSLPGAQDVEVKSLFAGGAEVVLSFPGGAERFAKAAGARGMTLNESRGEWILRQR